MYPKTCKTCCPQKVTKYILCMKCDILHIDVLMVGLLRIPHDWCVKGCGRCHLVVACHSSLAVRCYTGSPGRGAWCNLSLTVWLLVIGTIRRHKYLKYLFSF